MTTWREIPSCSSIHSPGPPRNISERRVKIQYKARYTDKKNSPVIFIQMTGYKASQLASRWAGAAINSRKSVTWSAMLEFLSKWMWPLISHWTNLGFWRPDLDTQGTLTFWRGLKQMWGLTSHPRIPHGLRLCAVQCPAWSDEVKEWSKSRTMSC